MIRLISSISAFLGILFILMKVFGIYSFFTGHDTFIWIGLSFFFISVFLLLINKIIEDRKIDRIVSSYKTGKGKKVNQTENLESSKGWSMNNSPFRERKTGLTWSGGNMKGANASRNTRKRFMG